MRRIAVIGAMLAGLFVAGCTEPDSRLDDGWKMLVAQEFNDARAHYESMLAEDPNNPYVNLNLGVAYEALGDSTQAAKHYQVAVANGKDAEIEEVAQDGNVAPRQTTVAKVAEENLAGLNS